MNDNKMSRALYLVVVILAVSSIAECNIRCNVTGVGGPQVNKSQSSVYADILWHLLLIRLLSYQLITQ